MPLNISAGPGGPGNSRVDLNLSIADELPIGTLELNEILVYGMEGMEQFCADWLMMHAAGYPPDLNDLVQSTPPLAPLFVDSNGLIITYELTQKCSGHTHVGIPLEANEALDFYNTTQLMRSIPVSTIRPYYYFPFDRYRLDYSLYLSGSATSENETVDDLSQGTNVRTVLTAPAWQTTAFRVRELGRNDEFGYRTIIDLQRPLAIRSLTLLLLISLLAFTFSIIFVEETGDVIAIALAILFSLLGIDDLLLPEYVTGTTLVHHTILSVYVALIFSVVVRFVFSPLWRRIGSLTTKT